MRIRDDMRRCWMSVVAQQACRSRLTAAKNSGSPGIARAERWPFLANLPKRVKVFSLPSTQSNCCGVRSREENNNSRGVLRTNFPPGSPWLLCWYHKRNTLKPSASQNDRRRECCLTRYRQGAPACANHFHCLSAKQKRSNACE